MGGGAGSKGCARAVEMPNTLPLETLRRQTQKSESRSPSVDRSISEMQNGEQSDEEGVPTLGNRAGNAVWSEARRPHTWRRALDAAAEPAPREPPPGSILTSLNLSHNQFTCVPPSLACLAPRLTRLNMAYNSLRSMSYVTSYPTSLRQLDLSHNEITCWPSLPQVESVGSVEGDPLACYCLIPASSGRSRPRSGGSVRSQLLHAACPARRHLRLEGLRTLILANNLLTRIQLTTDDDGYASSGVNHDGGAADDDEEWDSGSSVKARLLFPLLSMLDVSCNLLRAVPPGIHELTNLSVLNISGNKGIYFSLIKLFMGLLSRLWNLNTSGCPLQEPLRSMIQCGKYKSMDIVGYLKSVLEEAQPYTRMKLMFVGLQGIGKTSLLECLRQESAAAHRRKQTDVRIRNSFAIRCRQLQRGSNAIAIIIRYLCLQHWAKRMGNKTSRNRNMSTVGVDIGVWVYEKQRSSRGPLTFRTWDFGGQQEYYATHQYFLSRRSLYLVLWKVTEGKRGLAGALRWLRSIQARAPGSPVIIVATHYDQVGNSNLPENESPEALQRFIRSSIMGAPDADKLGLPRVLDSVEVSCSTRHNIRLLADIIYSVAYSVKPPGSKEPLLEQRVPATYLALEECVTHLAVELKEPVLRHDEYKRLVTQYMQQRNHRMFRDAAELHQATMFLHENGVILHYDDATLKELYFLRPQWLCDMLAHVVTVREINPFAGSGIMKLDDLAHVFKASPLLGRGEEARALCVSLLNKFELALAWDGRSLLVPPLLPARECNTQLPLRTRTWGSASRGTPRRAWIPSTLSSVPTEPSSAGTDSPKLVSDTCNGITITARNGARALRRLLLLSYVPCGFWPRLCARVLSDDAVAECAPPFYKAPPEIEADEATSKALDFNWAWKLWKTGLKLVCGELVLIVVREVMSRCDQLLGSSLPLGDDEEVMDEDGFGNLRFRLRQDGAWCDLEAQSSSCVEILLPAQVCVVRREDGMPMAGYQSISLEPNPEALARLLALISDHVDLLLEDWYPSLGTRFVHTSSGRCLITRVVPCPSCLREPMPSPAPSHDNGFMQAFKRLEINGGEAAPRRVRLSQESRTSDGDSGVGAESNASSRIGSVEGALSVRTNGDDSDTMSIAYGWTVEECILAACSNGGLQCPTHGELRLADLAPDTWIPREGIDYEAFPLQLLLDVEENRRARWDSITRGRLLGRGAFGVVLRAEWRRAGHVESVALKVLQPVPPGAYAGASARQAYKAAVSRWEREPAAAACRAYCGLRQELSVLTALRHQHVVPLRAVCASPLALLLTLAPMGALDSTLRVYRGCGARIGVRAARALALQVARALEYLHTKRIVYRDLKSENVLVWSMPKPQESHAAEASPASINVHVKLGDYGISRLAPPSGTKGFGGTEGFMAPEIMRYNGEEEYNEKVDCFSYGMLLYEIMSLRQPFEGHEAVKEAVLDGCRPTLSPRYEQTNMDDNTVSHACVVAVVTNAVTKRPMGYYALKVRGELQYPCCMLELMRRCWSTAPEHRPCSSALVSLTAAPEFTALQDACGARTALCAHAIPISTVSDDGVGGWEVWCGGEGERIHTLLATPTTFTHQHSLKIPPDNGDPVQVTAICRVGARVWIGDSSGRISVYSASTCAYVWGCCVQESVGGGPRAAVSAMQPLPSLARVAVALDSGRLFLVSSCRPAAEGSFVLSELGAASELKCLAAVPRPHGWEVWAGGAGLYAYAVNASGARGAEELRPPGRVALLAAANDEPYVFAHSQPGCVVQQWSVRTREVTARLDCSKLVPCSESLQSIAIDEHHPDNCQVRALCAFRSQLYAGTAWGCVVVADAATLRPVTVFRPYENEVRAIISLSSHEGADSSSRLATLGHGYRPLLHRYAPAQQTTTNTYGGMYCLLWRVDRWLPD
ncbi:hypothetical protein EVAR_15972_1 [Eumeta japonica]|uniref:non-specific serine/threonine protein kinase n=1 Tax=Eumeta variegata TaxID=151549 RepID=A0A4C1ULJ9_EUMVA|nr:hypothetical protein EVAR_15972_1 [Eumeta japonica]